MKQYRVYYLSTSHTSPKKHSKTAYVPRNTKIVTIQTVRQVIGGAHPVGGPVKFGKTNEIPDVVLIERAIQ